MLGLSLKQLWALMNTLQIITHMPMLNVPFPSNIQMIISSLKDISNMNIIPQDYIDKAKSALLPKGLTADAKGESLGLLFLLIPSFCVLLLTISLAIFLVKRS